MNNDYILYSVKAKFLLGSPLNFEINGFSVYIEAKDSVLLVRFDSLIQHSSSDLEMITEVELERILDKISFLHSVTFNKYFDVKKCIDGKISYSNILPGSYEITKPPLTIDQSNQLKQFLEEDTDDTTLLGMYRFSLTNNNEMEQFMLLYGIIYMLYSNQERVDNFIKEGLGYVSAEEKESGNPHRTSMETIYTWLRNQIGHLSINTDINDVREKIKNKLPSFREIVKKAIIVNTTNLDHLSVS